MKEEDLGIDVKTGRHVRTLTHAEEVFTGILWEEHVGQENAISADNLALEFAARLEGRHMAWESGWHEFWKRDVRRMHNHLLTMHSHIPILSKAGGGGGYWIAESEQEAEAFYDTFRKRGLTGLVKASRGKQAAMVDMVTQLSFEWEELVDRSGMTGPIRPKVPMPAPIEMVDAFLTRMTRNPEKFADGLRKIGEKFGGVLLPKEKVAALKIKAREFERLVAELGE